jgi:hypothetical protein
MDRMLWMPAKGQRPRLADVNVCRSFGNPAVCGVTGGGSLWLAPGCFRPPLVVTIAPMELLRGLVP